VRTSDLPSLHAVLTRGSRVMMTTLVAMIPLVTLSQILAGSSDAVLGGLYNGLIESLLLGLLGLSYTTWGRREPEAIIWLVATVMIPALLFAASHTVDGKNDFAVFAIVVPVAMAGFAPIRPVLTLALGIELLVLYPLSLWLAPYPNALPVWLASAMSGALTVMGAAACQVQRFVWADLDKARSSADTARETAEEQFQLLERYALELERARNDAVTAARMKGEFLANMSHEIRTPMTAILGFTEVLLGESGSLSGEALDALQTIHRNGEHLCVVINDILDLSKIESGKLEVERLRCSPAQIVDDVVALMVARATERGLALGVRYEGAVPESILSDPTRLKQVLLNLVGNAVKFTESGSIELRVRLLSTFDDPAAKLRFSVVDSGIGMTPEQLGRVFEAFAQADGSTTRRFGGTGLGLTISKRLAGLLGGDLVAESEFGRGSAFHLDIATGSLAGVPVLRSTGREPGATARTGAPASTTAAPLPAPAAPAAERRRLDASVLVAEDGPDNQRLITKILGSAGLRVEIAANGRLACDKILAALRAGEGYDIVLMDMQMPELDGYDATRLLRSEGFTGPIIALTAHAMVGQRERCIAAGCDEYVPKPIKRTELLDKIEALLGKS